MHKSSKVASWIIVGIIVIAVSVSLGVKKQSYSTTLDTIYGKFEVRDPCVIEILQNKSMQRMRDVHQYGVLRYATPTEDYSRYDHSVGVYVLLRKYGLSQPEQISGLVHDLSHTAFSHVGDFVFNNRSFSYQDDIHDWYLRTCGLTNILEKYGYSAETIHHKRADFKALEQDLPVLCADRIEYNLQGGLRRGLLSQKDVDTLLTHLKFDYPNWYFTDVESAKKLARVSLNMTENVWGAAWGLLIFQWAADALNRAMSLGIITVDDFHFSSDDIIWHKLIASPDPFITERISRIINYEKQFFLTTPKDRDLLLRGKFRGVDPFVKTDRGLQYLTEIDAEYAKEFHQCKEKMEAGWSIKLTNGIFDPQVPQEFSEATTSEAHT